MSSKYSESEEVPNEVLAKRLEDLSWAIIHKWGESLLDELTMRVPAELDRDADLVLSEAAKRLRKQCESVNKIEMNRALQAWVKKPRNYQGDGQSFKAGYRAAIEGDSDDI